MCGIVGAVAERNVVPILMEGLRRLEYRGYDSAGIAIENREAITRVRRAGKVQELQHALDTDPVQGTSGISHTRWATHCLTRPTRTRTCRRMTLRSCTTASSKIT